MSKRTSKQGNGFKNLKKSAWKTITRGIRNGQESKEILHSVFMQDRRGDSTGNSRRVCKTDGI